MKKINVYNEKKKTKLKIDNIFYLSKLIYYFLHYIITKEINISTNTFSNYKEK